MVTKNNTFFSIIQGWVWRCIFTQFFHWYMPYTYSIHRPLVFYSSKLQHPNPNPKLGFEGVQTRNPGLEKIVRVWNPSKDNENYGSHCCRIIHLLTSFPFDTESTWHGAETPTHSPNDTSRMSVKGGNVVDVDIWLKFSVSRSWHLAYFYL